MYVTFKAKENEIKYACEIEQKILKQLQIKGNIGRDALDMFCYDYVTKLENLLHFFKTADRIHHEQRRDRLW